MTTSRRTRNTLIARILIVLFSALLANTAIAERWQILWTGNFGAQGAIELDSITPAPEYPSAMGFWFYVHRGIDTFDCSPPTNCLATSQLTYYYVDCGRMQAAVIRRIPMNLRGKVVEIIDAPVPVWFSLVWHPGRRDRRGEDLEVWERHHREARYFCGKYDVGLVDRALKSYVPLLR